jgi:hypothetical protein
MRIGGSASGIGVGRVLAGVAWRRSLARHRTAGGAEPPSRARYRDARRRHGWAGNGAWRGCARVQSGFAVVHLLRHRIASIHPDMPTTLSRDWLAVIAAAILILLVKLGIASGVPW